MSPSYDQYGRQQYGRQPIGIGERQRRRRGVSSRAPERGNSINPDARRKASMTVNAREVTQSEPPPPAAYRRELTIEEPSAQVDEASG